MDIWIFGSEKEIGFFFVISRFLYSLKCRMGLLLVDGFTVTFKHKN